MSGSSPKLTLRRKNGIAVSPRVLDKWPVIFTYVFNHRAKLSMHESAASECGNGCWNHIIRGTIMTGNIPYLSLITWVSLTSIKEMEHSPDEFKVGRWSCHSCLGCQVEGGNLDPSENNIFSVSKCAICSSLCLKGGTLTLSKDSFPGHPLVAKVPAGVQTNLKGTVYSLATDEQEMNMAECVHKEPHQGSLDAREEDSKSCLIFKWEAKVAKPKMFCFSVT